MRRRSLRILPVVAIALAVVAAGQAFAERATVVRSGNLILRINGDVSPEKLPKKKMAPVTLRASGNLGTVDGSHPPAAKTVTIDFDKQGAINARGLATCRSGQLQSRNTAAAKAACRKAIVGSGSTTVQVSFPEQAPFRANGPLVLFNGGVRKGVTKMFIHAYVNVPTPTALVTVVKVKKIRKGPYGTRAIARIPKIAGGSGSLIRFNLKVRRTFQHKGKRQSYLLARCGNGRLRAHAVMRTSDGTRIGGSILRRCKARG
ncbi:MAG TPA: hypothetical protein VFY69_02605 [Solirubrobacterales bacterium]|nr:hypothetical protein [Solirubrobacterales bacterium]